MLADLLIDTGTVRRACWLGLPPPRYPRSYLASVVRMPGSGGLQNLTVFDFVQVVGYRHQSVAFGVELNNGICAIMLSP